MATTTSMARSIARWICELKATPLAPAVLEKAKVCLIDMIGVAAQAADLPCSRQATGYAAAMGGTQATLIGSATRASVADAAFANATMAHGLVQEDMHTPSVSHIGVVVWPALLALAEQERATGIDFLLSGVAGYQVMGRLGQALITKDVARAFRPTGLIGAVGAAAAGARLVRLSEDETVSALALAANTAGGLNEWPHVGGDEMYFHAGMAARDLGGGWEILAVYHKPAPACNYAQTPAQAALALTKKTPVKAGDIEHVVVKSFPEAIAYPGCDHTGPYRTLLQAKMSIQFVVAAALVHGRVDDAVLRDFSIDSEAARLARRVRLQDDAGFAGGFPQRQGAEVVVTTKSGRSASLRLAELEPLDAAGVRSRMRASLARLLDEARAQSIAREIDAIVGCQDASRIVRLLAQ